MRKNAPYYDQNGFYCIPVTKTILTWCFVANANESCWNGLPKQTLKVAESKRTESAQKGFGKDGMLQINVKLEDIDGNCNSDPVAETIIYQSDNKKGVGKIRVNLSRLSNDLQDIFWFSAVRELYNNGRKKGEQLDFESQELVEWVGVKLDIENKVFIIRPIKVVDLDVLQKVRLSPSDSVNLLKILCDFKKYTGGEYQLAVKGGGKLSEKYNRVFYAGQWTRAAEFHGIEKGKKNCIYYLASEPEAGKPRKLYIGEAKNSGGRLVTRVVDGKTYIGHSKRSDDFNKHRFAWYRIDQLVSLEALHDAQDAIIGSFNMADSQEFPNGFVLTNMQYNKAYSKADQKRKKQ